MLETQNRSAVARKLGKSRVTVARWANSEGVPPASDLPLLADLLHIDLGTLTRIVAADAKRISQDRSMAGDAA